MENNTFWRFLKIAHKVDINLTMWIMILKMSYLNELAKLWDWINKRNLMTVPENLKCKEKNI